jgi:tetratricopeptide (TPR) repeat protein
MKALFGMAAIDLLYWVLLVPVVVALGFRAFANSDDRRILLVKWISSALLLALIAAIMSMHTVFKGLFILPFSVILGFIWVPTVGRMILKPLTASFEGNDEVAEPKPFYYLAEGKRRQGLYEEAAAEIRRQLEQFPGDVEGMMKLATLQAEDMHNVPAAVTTMNELLQQPNLAPNHVVAALQTLGDWQLNLAHDSSAAQESFKRITELFPNSSYSHLAEQRLAHLEGVEQTRNFHKKTVFKVRLSERNVGLQKISPQIEPAPPDADALAAEYVSQLEKHPNDTETRENLAMLYAEKLDRLDLAVDQLEQLASLPNETSQHIAHWLDLLATLYIRFGRDVPSAESALRRIVDRFPNTSMAIRATARLTTLQGELKAVAGPVITKTIGVYEKNLGLKGKSPGMAPG